MARSDKRYMVYPAPRAIEIIGSTSPSLNQALECWAALMARAMADNAETFSKSYSETVGDRLFEHGLHDWGLMANVLRNTLVDPDFANPRELLATAVEDTHRLEKVGREWFWSECDIEWKEVDAAVQELVEKLRSKDFDYVHAWALIGAVQWFWEHHDKGINIKDDSWWTPAFRRQWNPKQAQKRNSQGDSTDQKQGKRKKSHTERKK